MPCVDELVKLHSVTKTLILFQLIGCHLSLLGQVRLFRRKNHTSMEEVAAFVQAEIARME